MDAHSLKYCLVIVILACTACSNNSLPNNSEIEIQVTELSSNRIQLSAKNSSLPISDLKWDFGDGYTADGNRVSHRYMSGGTYIITLSFEQESEIKTRTTTIDILGNNQNLYVSPSSQIAIDSDHNDPNQPFERNDETPQILNTPIELSGILIEKNACQAGQLCDAGDDIDLFQFDVPVGLRIQLEQLSGLIDAQLRHLTSNDIVQATKLTNRIIWDSDTLVGGRYELSIKRNPLTSKAQYKLTIQQSESGSQGRYQPGKLIVRWKGNSIPELVDIHDPRLTNSSSTISARTQLQNDHRVDQVDFNYYRYASSSYLDIWQWPLLQSDMPAVWKPLLSRGDIPGKGSIIAVLDTGVYFEHENFLNTQFVDGYDFVSDIINSGDGNGWDRHADDPGDSKQSYHGTHIMGIIAATPEYEKPSHINNQWISGVAWGASIMPLRVLGMNGGTSYDLIQALRYAAGLPNDSGRLPSKPADVINLSLGGTDYSPLEHQTISEVINSGAIVVAAAGNHSSDKVDYPAAYSDVISVGASTIEENTSNYSNSGPRLLLSAPGGECSSTSCTFGINSLSASGTMSISGMDSRKSMWKRMAGTSMATAHVSGLIGILKAKLPALDSKQLIQWIENQVITDPNHIYSQQTGFGPIATNQFLNIMDNSADLSSGIWVNLSSLIMRQDDTSFVYLTSRGEIDFDALEFAFDDDKFRMNLTDQTLHITLLKDLEHPEVISVKSPDGVQVQLNILPPLTSELPIYAEHLYIEIEGQPNGLRTIREESNWIAITPLVSEDTYIQASTDIDYDGVYCEPGEFCAQTRRESELNASHIVGEILE